MKFKYQLPDLWIDKVAHMEEFANGGTQVTVRLESARDVCGVLVSNSMYVVAVRGCDDLPFALEEIADIFQTADDKKPAQRGGWNFWDDWNGSDRTTK